ncbi:pyrimidine 5'-nucleotidase [Bradyrhizobium sp. BRP22]|uniref:pyrimidine 5'-nucleotidase n=1 Tax=Bradyrhizobium sp. BRP22 TaxID=2793821 RepID=UPI001CD772D1|nr:pyrimidine 5'-nucleotidase [Bradyrhizobium sp. BRP22]MCA1454118.1 pyrimidine 5'-nucleotidase [Bradyrhizobium sp. BRP22]
MIVSASTREVERNDDRRGAFAHVENWIFDLDDTLYPRSLGLHEQLKRRVVAFIADHVKVDPVAAEAIHLAYYERFGSTLQGMAERHGAAPHEFLAFVHDIDLSALVPNERLISRLAALPGKRIVFTNASRDHALAALAAMGLSDVFDVVASIEDNGFVGKPHPSAFEKLFISHEIDPAASAMFEDRPGNLVIPHELGMKTVLVVDPILHRDPLSVGYVSNHIDVVVTNLAAFLDDLQFKHECGNNSALRARCIENWSIK